MKDEAWLSVLLQSDCYDSCWMVIENTYESPRQAHFLHAIKHSTTPLVGADCADEVHRVTQTFKIGGKIEGGPTKIFPASDDIPQDLTDADGLHRVASCRTGLGQ